uniref:SDR family NAD(P)-dependent oxidoreductase n=1 Tax=Paenibacillus hexagrammi TaxID=2908839 RepID=UPI0021A7422B|nr:SDR family NAD(P)-dependent oxidoreductase [Paenibacillus sp. YPD9-1]
MDPQERLFLECVYEAMEDAGYTRETLGSNRESGLDGDVGVYVGVMYEDYQLFGVEEQTLGRPIAAGGTLASIANRVSYFFNLHGPSMAVETMCSSSLTAIHLACQSIQRGGCELAIAGGVNISLHPNKYLKLSQGKFISSKGRCESFGEGGDGYVPGEGVGAILLKPLSKAIADGDQIYGVIKGTAINHGGKTNGYTVPSPNAQGDLIGKALKEAGVNPRTISYLEAHGTGTELGDPIEITGLTRAFGRNTPDKQFCAIGSVKSNIGHCEGAAGIAGLTKVLLQFKHGQIVPSLHSKVLNPYIEFKETPFVVEQELREWKRPWIEIDGELKEYPRRAGVSSFGAGGSNAHLIIEEYMSEVRERAESAVSPENTAIIVLSAKNEERLQEQVVRLIAAIQEQPLTEKDLIDTAYTLQVGREAMEERLAVIVSSLKDLQAKLTGYLEGKDDIEGLYRGQIKRSKEAVSVFTADEDLLTAIDAWISKRKYGKLLDLWVKGLSIDWNRLYPGTKPRRISLPTYPFAKERYWIPESQTGLAHGTVAPITGSVIHPLLHQNTSDLTEQRFSTTWTGREFFLTDHVIKGQRVLPGAACLEMARAAVAEATREGDEVAIKLKNVVWTQPIVVGEQPLRMHIGLYPEDNGEIEYEIYREDEADFAESVVYGQGRALLSPVKEKQILHLKDVQEECNLSILTSEELYKTFRMIGIEYGPGHQGIENVYLGKDQALAELSLPMSIRNTQDQYVLHPSILDSALQATIGLRIGGEDLKPALPFALREIEILGRCTPKMWAWIRNSTNSHAGDRVRKLDIDVCDEQGNVCIRMKELSSRALEGEKNTIESAIASELFMLEPVWEERLNARQSSAADYAQHLILLCELSNVTSEAIEERINGVRCVTLHSPQLSIAERFQRYAVRVFEEIQSLAKLKPKKEILIQLVVPNQGEEKLFSGLLGLLKTAQIENPKLIGQLIEVEASEGVEGLKVMLEASSAIREQHIRYQSGKQLVTRWKELEVQPEAGDLPWKDRGVYLITGGLGGLGLVFAEEIAARVQESVLILTGRSSLNEVKQARLKKLENLGAHIVYRQVDVTDQQAVTELIRSLHEQFGHIDGIIHSAGLIKDNFIIKKTKDEFVEVLAPKVTGLENLDQASKDLRLDFFILFSSLTGRFGNIGQADYSTANAFMDAYANYRNRMVQLNRRHGKTLSVNWPLWRDGGMGVDQEREKIMTQNTGMIPMQTQTGIRALYQGLALRNEQVVVMEGDIGQFRANLIEPTHHQDRMTNQNTVTGDDSKGTAHSEELLYEKAINYLKKMLASVIKLPSNRIEADVKLEVYGIDSVMVMQVTNLLEKEFGSLSKTLLFEYQSIQELAGYLVETHREQLQKIWGIEDKAATSITQDQRTGIDNTKIAPKSRRRKRFASSKESSAEKGNEAFDVAIIGVSGRYPGARNLQEFWNNLRDGKDSIIEIPKERWDSSVYYDEDKTKPGKMYSKWGGFLEGVDQFDPLFFNISPREAELMDPQERLFLECVYEAMEDAGYTRETLGSYRGLGLEGNVGVYVGVMYDEYQLFGAQEQMLGRPVLSGGTLASIANRVSYFFNFHGPSMAVETMCSSSLTAIHLACQSIQRGGCELAIAGGVNVSLHPNKYLKLSQGKFTSSKGRCESFGEGGDGYVPGEGVGAVLLKPLSKAIADGDQIYGVIKGTAINHGGKNNGYTVPSPNAQGVLVGHALKEAGVNPRTISYLEAHGTGTSLGDPIEINGLTRAFGQDISDKQFCAIGSVKSNIGHCEGAAGIAGLTKVLLQFKYGQIVPSLHSKVLNPHIDFKETPFVVQQELTEWKRPWIEIDGELREYPRRAGISSFGAGGANAHMVIEEYVSEDGVRAERAVSPDNPVMIVLSAKNEERLKEQVGRLIAAIQEQPLSEKDLMDTAYTLQVGREAMEERLAIIVSSLKELQEKLTNYLDGKDDIEDLYRGQIKRNKETMAIFAADEDMVQIIDAWISKRKYGKLLDLWVKGFNVDWNKLYPGIKPRRISLPTYPFAKERYWIPESETGLAGGTVAPIAGTVIHPFLHQNTSDLTEQRFSTTWTGREFFLTDHVIKGQRVLPGAACLEMARAAVAEATREQDGAVIKLKNVVWTQPVVAGEQPLRVHIGLYPDHDGEIEYEIYREDEADPSESVVYSQGRAVLSHMDEKPVLPLKALQEECSQRSLSSNELYQAFRALGIEYGPGHQGIEKVDVGEGQALAELSLPVSVRDTQDQYVLHPSILDSALQASIGLRVGSEDLKPALPFALREIEILGACTPRMWAWIRNSTNSHAGDRVRKLDIDICDEQGNVCIRMKELSSRVLEAEMDSTEPSDAPELFMLEPVWEERLTAQQSSAADYAQHLILLCELSNVNSEAIEERMNGVRCVTLQSPQQSIAERFQRYAVRVFEEIQSLVKEKSKKEILIQLVVPNQGEEELFSGLLGLLKTAQMENPKLIGQLIEVEANEGAEGLEVMLEASSATREQHIRYQSGKQLVTRWKEIEVQPEAGDLPWKDRGVYLITGGLGGLGLVFAKEIAARVQESVLILTGRSSLNEASRAKLKELETQGANIVYRQVDVTDQQEVTELIRNLQEQFGHIDGIIHSAGVIRDNYMMNKTKDEFIEVLAPKGCRIGKLGPGK